ncbi:response regulator [Lysobacter koreensis]|uniref:histidine kinase n=2 Tax=Lysobacter koreensis TaxID=266122 RepID=A0ABW2YP12_9GAMM
MPVPVPLSAAADPVNILLVDDQPARLLAYRAILEPLGENLVEANSGTAALKALMEGEFGLILLDVNMPVMDGFETASLIHQHPRFEKTPIIFVTAVNVSDMDRMRGYKLGAVDYVMVPIIPEILRSKVMVLAELYRKRRELQLANESLAAANAALQLEKARELDVLNDSLLVANTQLASRNDELQAQVSERMRAQARLLELDRRKDEFLATLAHELRNPMASLGNAINVLKLMADPPGSGAAAARDVDAPDNPLHDTMQRQMGLLVRLIDDLLDVARINQGKLTLQPQATSVQAVLDTAIETVQPLLQAGDHALGVHVPAQAIALHADRDRLAQVFSNLLNNAVKYSDPGTPIELRVERSDDTVEVTVADRGIGLDPAHAADVFDLFTQVDTSVERARGGLGIGLTLVKRIVEMHGGRVQAASAGLGRGSRFTVALPLDAPLPLAAPVAEPAGTATGGCVRCRALVIDDNRDSADTLAMMLELLGHETRRVYEPQAALAAAREFAPDIVFLDIGMPGLSGYDVAGLLRAAPGGESLVLVAVTGWGQPDDRRRTLEAGFDHHLVKPPEMAAISGICRALPRRDGEGAGDA